MFHLDSLGVGNTLELLRRELRANSKWLILFLTHFTMSNTWNGQNFNLLKECFITSSRAYTN